MDREYYEDIKLHEKSRSRGFELIEQEMVEFARVWEPRPHHVDAEFARKTEFGSLIAAGNYLISILYRLVYELSYEKSPPGAYIAALGLDEVRFLAPARAGDVLVLEYEAISKRDSKSRPHAGIVSVAHKLLNQRNEIVLTMKGSALVERRPTAS